MKEKLIEHLDEIEELVRSGAAFTAEQPPLLVTELLTYYTVYHALWTVFCLLAIPFTIYAGRRLYSYDEDTIILIILVGLAALAVSIVGLFENLSMLLKVTLAPRLFLLETIQNLL